MKRSTGNFLFLKKYQELQLSITYDSLDDLSFAIIGYCQSDPSTYWNNALTNQVLSDTQIKKIEDRFSFLSRSTTVYFEDTQELIELGSKLISKQYIKNFEDSWLFWKGGLIDTRYFDSVMRVTSSAELEIFLQTFNDCYQDNDPQNPYGEQSGYLESAKKAWHKNNSSGRLEYYVVFKNSQPVSVSSLTNYDGIGYISNVGSLKKVRGRGYGKAATLFCVKESIKNSNKVHCLATEEDSYPDEFYKKIGFELRFKAVGYTLAKV